MEKPAKPGRKGTETLFTEETSRLIYFAEKEIFITGISLLPEIPGGLERRLSQDRGARARALARARKIALKIKTYTVPW